MTGGFAILRALLRQRRRLLLAGLSIALGVGYLAGSLGLLGRIGAGLDDLASASADRADVVIEGSVAYESSLEQVRRLVPASLADTAAGTSGVDSVSHRLEDIVLVIDSEGDPVAAPGLSEQPLGINWPEDSAVSNLDLVEGRAPAEDGEVVLDEHTADSARVGVGDTVRVGGKGKVGEYRVTGIVDSESLGRSAGSSLVAFTTDEARVVFDQPVDDNRIAIKVDPGASVTQVISDLEGRMPPGAEVVDGATAALHAQEGLTRSFTIVRVLVTGFGVLALLVGMVTVANSLTLLHAQRRRLFATFRLVGARRNQLRRAALSEAAILAVASSLLGLPLGLLLAVLIERALGALGTAVPTAGPLLTPQAAGIAMGVGLLATLGAAWRPVRSACSVPPIEAVQAVDRPTGSPRPFAVIALARALVGAVAVAGVTLIASAQPMVVVISSVCVGAFIFLVSFLPLILTTAVSATMRLLPFRPRPLRRVAARDAARNPRRTAATTAAVLLAAAVISGLAVFLSSFTASVEGVVDNVVSANLVVDSETFTRGGLPADLVDQLGFVDGVTASSGWQLGRGSVGDSAVRMTGLDSADAAQVIAPDFVEGGAGDMTPSSAWISSQLAAASGFGVGDVMPVVFYSGGFDNLTVTGVYSDGRGLLGDVVLDRSVLSAQVPATYDLAALVRTDGSTSTTKAVEDLAASYGITAVSTPAKFVGQRSEMLRGFERVVLWMLLFTLLQALVGVVNTLMLSVGERRREFGLLRVAGTSRRALLKMVLYEGVSFSSVGTLLGIGIGTAAAAVAIWALGPLGFGVFTVPVPTLVFIAVAAVAVGVGAAWFPARMASRVPPLEAIGDIGAEPTLARAPRRVTRPLEPSVAISGAGAHLAGSAVPARTVAAVPAASGPISPVTAVAASGNHSLMPPPFDPSRVTAPLPANLTAAVSAPVSESAVLSVAVLDGSSVFNTEAGSDEAKALLALYDMLPSAVAATPEPQTAAHAQPASQPVAQSERAESVPGPAQPVQARPAVPDVTPSMEAAIGVLLSDALFGSSEATAVDPTAIDPTGVHPTEVHPITGVPGEVLPGEAQPAEVPPPVAEPPAAVPPTPPRVPMAGAPEPVSAGLPEQRRGLRRSKRNDPADRRPPRRVRRGQQSAAAEGWVTGDTTADAGVGRGTLAGAVERLDEETREHWAAVLHSMNAALASGEDVGPLVCGRVRAEPAAVTRTDRRLLLVAQRPGRMAVESLHPIATGVVVRPGPGGTLVVVLYDRGRALELTEVHDAREAEALVRRDELEPNQTTSISQG